VVATIPMTIPHAALLRRLALILAPEASGMSVKEELHKLGVEVEPECLQAIERSGQVY
jgi:hypothetical protein